MGLNAVTDGIALGREATEVKAEPWPVVPGLLQLAVSTAMRLPFARIALPKGKSLSARREAVVIRQHHSRTSHPKTRRQMPPVVDHLRDNHRNGDHSADNQNQIMR